MTIFSKLIFRSNIVWLIGVSVKRFFVEWRSVNMFRLKDVLSINFGDFFLFFAKNDQNPLDTN
jgi:hypothetical protein